MHRWTIEKWKLVLPAECIVPRNRICVISDRDTNEEVRLACKEFIAWAKAEYRFPLPLRIYLRNQAKLRTMDGSFATGTFFEPSCYGKSSYIRIAVGDYEELASEIGRDNALATILSDVAHELTHYFQWVNNLHLTDRGRERQAGQYARFIMSEYAQTREHP